MRQTMANEGGFLGNLTKLIEKLGELAEKGQELRENGTFESGKDVKGVYGFTIRTAQSGDGVKVEPFGNVKTDATTGRTTVGPTIEPPVDVFEEDDHLLIVIELPGMGVEDVNLQVEGATLLLKAEHGAKKFAKVVPLPRAVSATGMTFTCRNGVLEVKLPNA